MEYSLILWFYLGAIIGGSLGIWILYMLLWRNKRKEKWLFNNPSALADVKQGIKEAGDGQLYDLGSFAQYVKDLDESERWLFENPTALNKVLRGLRDSKAGRVHQMDFSKYAEEPDDQEE